MKVMGSFLQKAPLKRGNQRGFTLVELLIVIVIIAILAAITIVAYNGIQARARDAARVQALQQVETALAAYYTDNGQYPVSGGSTITGITSWNTTADASWNTLATALQPYVSTLPTDPNATAGANVLSNAAAYDFAYFSNSAGAYCNSGKNQMYLIVYRLEASAPPLSSGSACTGTALGPYGSTATKTGNYYMISG